MLGYDRPRRVRKEVQLRPPSVMARIIKIKNKGGGDICAPSAKHGNAPTFFQYSGNYSINWSLDFYVEQNLTIIIKRTRSETQSLTQIIRITRMSKFISSEAKR